MLPTARRNRTGPAYASAIVRRPALMSPPPTNRAPSAIRHGDSGSSLSRRPRTPRPPPEGGKRCGPPPPRPIMSWSNVGSPLATARPAPAPRRAPRPPRRSATASRSARAVAGSRSRLRSCVEAYLPSAEKNEWHGNAGSKPCAAPRPRPTVSTRGEDRRRLGPASARTPPRSREVRPGRVGKLREVGLVSDSACPIPCDTAATRPPPRRAVRSSSIPRRAANLQQEVGLGTAAVALAMASGLAGARSRVCKARDVG